MLKKLTFGIALLAGVVGCASAPPTAKLLSSGIYAASSSMRISDPNVPTGHYSLSSGVALTEQTDRVVASLGTRFGVSYSFDGPANRVVRHTVIWKFPEPGMQNPTSGQTAKQSKRDIGCATGTECWAGRTINEPWEVIEGPWILEIWEGQKKLLTHTIIVSKAPLQ